MAKLNKPSLGTTIRQNSSGVLAALMCIVIGLVIGYVKSKGYKVVPEAFRKSDMV